MIIQVEIDTLFPLGAIVRQVVDEVHRANRGPDDPRERFHAAKRYASAQRKGSAPTVPLAEVMMALMEHEMALRGSQRRSWIAKAAHARRKAQAEADAFDNGLLTVSEAIEARLADQPSLSLEQTLMVVMDVQRAYAESVERSSRAKSAHARRKASSQPPQASAP